MSWLSDIFLRSWRVIDPKVGEKWLLSCAIKDPWGQPEYPPVTITGVKDGWVRYDFSGPIFKDQRKTIRDFVSMYHRVEE